MSEQRTITITAHRTPAGEPTCCASAIPPRQMCRWLRTKAFGTFDLCAVSLDPDHEGLGLERGNDGNGYLIPASDCPVWHGSEQ